MKLLFDQNLSPRFAGYCEDIFADFAHVYFLGIDTAEDLNVWDYARSNSFTIVTKDSDYNNIVSLLAFLQK